VCSSSVLTKVRYSINKLSTVGKKMVTLLFPEDGVDLVSKRGCLLTLAYYAFPRWYEFGERRWNDILTGENEELGEKPVPVPLFPPQIPHGLSRARKRASAVRGRRLTAWAMVRPKVALIVMLLLRVGIAQDFSFTTTITHLLCFPIWVLIIPDTYTRALWQ
jgi:hypothetical protein